MVLRFANAYPLACGRHRIWSRKWESNPRPRPYQGRALPSELCRRNLEPAEGVEPTTNHLQGGCSTKLSYTGKLFIGLLLPYGWINRRISAKLGIWLGSGSERICVT